MKYMEDTNQSFKIRFVNRLDMDTTGLLIVAKNSHAQDDVVKQMFDGHAFVFFCDGILKLAHRNLLFTFVQKS